MNGFIYFSLQVFIYACNGKLINGSGPRGRRFDSGLPDTLIAKAEI